MIEVNFIPFPTINTSRLLLGQIKEQHAGEIVVLRSDEKAMQYIDREKTQTIEEAKTLIKKIDTDINNGDGITWKISSRENPELLIGTIGFWRIVKQHYRAEVGYMLHPHYWGKGLMNEALLAVIDFGFNNLHLHSIEAHINPANVASAGILEKTGFTRDAYFKEDYFFRGKFLDTAIYSLLNKK